MVTKLPTTKIWTDAIKDSELDDKGFSKKLAELDRLPATKPADRLKAITTINKLAVDLKPKVSKLPAASKYLAEVTKALEKERLDIQKASAGATLEATIKNNSDWDDVIVTIEDLNLGRNQVIVDRERLNKKDSFSVTLAADGDGEGYIRWTAYEPDDTATKKQETVKDIKHGQTIKVGA